MMHLHTHTHTHTLGSTQEMLPVISTHPASDIYPESTPSQPIVVLLTCIADGEDTLAWLYNGTPVSESDPDRTVGPSSLTIPQFSAALAGEYSCQASNSVGTVTSAIAMIQAPGMCVHVHVHVYIYICVVLWARKKIMFMVLI